MSDNLKVWDQLSHTDPKYTKAFNRGGFKGTATNPTWQLKRLTEVYGPAGKGWYYDDVKTAIHESGQGHILVYLSLNLYVNNNGEWSKPIRGVGGDFIVNIFSNGPKADDEAFKKAETDALGNAMKKLGLAADVHMGLFDDNKYVNEMNEKFAEPAPKPEPSFSREDKITQIDMIDEINHCMTPAQLEEFWNNYGGEIEKLPEVFQTTIVNQYDSREKQINEGLTPLVNYGFSDVKHAEEWGRSSIVRFKTMTEKQIIDWHSRNAHKIDALDEKLNAAKYQLNGTKPSQRLRKDMNDRILELKGVK